MKYIYAVNSYEEFKRFQSFQKFAQPKLEAFLEYLKTNFALSSLPRAVVWTGCETATCLLSDIPIPAYTNDYRTIFCPELQSWKKIYLQQLNETQYNEISAYYECKLTDNHVLQILGHEFVHHSDFFPEGEYTSGIWFEEGMCEYISRKYFLSEQEFEEAAHINALLVDRFREQYGEHSLEEFGSATYQRDYSGIFFEYWRSFLAVRRIIDQFDGDVLEVFREYHGWYHSGREKSLAEWFHLSI